jgi:excinuclease UvrABC nuclease subunit
LRLWANFLIKLQGGRVAIKKTVSLTKAGIKRIPNDKPGVYDIKSGDTKSKYVGMAQKGRLQERVKEHLPSSSKDPIKGGKTVAVKQTASKASALKIEKAIIKSKQPPQNKKGK